jgi:hypothetical protein
MYAEPTFTCLRVVRSSTASPTASRSVRGAPTPLPLPLPLPLLFGRGAAGAAVDGRAIDGLRAEGAARRHTRADSGRHRPPGTTAQHHVNYSPTTCVHSHAATTLTTRHRWWLQHVVVEPKAYLQRTTPTVLSDGS